MKADQAFDKWFEEHGYASYPIAKDVIHDVWNAALDAAAEKANRRRSEHCPSGPGCAMCETASLIEGDILALKG